MATISDIGGGNNDFPDLISWGNARGSSSDLEIAHVFSNQVFSTDFDHRTDFLGGYEVVGMGDDFAGDFSNNNVITITRSGSYTGHLIDDRTGRGSWRNIIFDSSGGDLLLRDFTRIPSFTLCGFFNSTTQPYFQSNASANVTFQDCAFLAGGLFEAGYFFRGQVTLENCIFYGQGDSLGLVRFRSCTAAVTDTIANTTDSLPSFAQTGSTITGSGCVSDDTTASNLGIGGQDSLLGTYFEDPLNQNLQINAEGQAALPLGLAWAYVEGAGGETLIPTLIPSGEVVGTPSVTNLLKLIEPNTIPTEELVDTPTVDAGAILISPATIPTGEVVYNVSVVDLTQFVEAENIPTQEVVGSPNLELLLSRIFPASIATQENFGTPVLIGGDRIAIPINDRATWNRVATFLRTRQFKGSDNDVILAWLRSEGYIDTFNDAFNTYLEDVEALQGSLTDKYSNWRRQ